MATDAQTLINQVAAQGYEKLSKRELIECLLVAAQVGGGGGTPSYQDMQVAWTPTNVKLGEKMGFITQGAGLSGITKIIFQQSTSEEGFIVTYTSNLTEIDFPNLITVDPTNLDGSAIDLHHNPSLSSVLAPLLVSTAGALQLNDCPNLTVFNFPSLVSIGTYLSGYNCGLTSVNLPLLATVAGNIRFDGNVGLTTVNMPSLVPSASQTIIISGCALSAASVQLILRRCVLAGVATATIDLSGGTSAGVTSLNAQGQADVATLGAQLTINA